MNWKNPKLKKIEKLKIEKLEITKLKKKNKIIFLKYSKWIILSKLKFENKKIVN